MKIEKHQIEFSQGTSVLHRFYTEKSNKVIFLIHGYFENSTIFYSKSGKGLAPYLAENGYDVFVCDLIGKGESTPKVSRDLDNSQYEIITRDLPKLIDRVRAISQQNKINIGAHSWGGVVAYAYLARSKDQNINAIVTFGTKRRISLKNLRKFIVINIGWNWWGQKMVKKYGYLPAAKMRLGNDNEPKSYYQEACIWVEQKEWKSPTDNFNYLNEFDSSLPPSLFITGKGDKILGNPKDVTNFANEINAPNTIVKVIGKQTGHIHNYDHINLLTHKDARKDHFKLVLSFLEEHNRF